MGKLKSNFYDIDFLVPWGYIWVSLDDEGAKLKQFQKIQANFSWYKNFCVEALKEFGWSPAESFAKSCLFIL